MIEKLEHIDRQIFLFFNGLHSVFFDTVMYWISNQYIWIPLYAFLIFIIVRKYRIKAIYMILCLIITLFVTDQLSVHLFKNVFLRYRPSHNMDIKHLVHIVNNYHGGKYGFISSHAANTFGFATIYAYLYKNRKLSIYIFIWAALVSYSRLYLGVHYPADLFCGAIFGVIVGFLIYKAYKLCIHFFTKKTESHEKN